LTIVEGKIAGQTPVKIDRTVVQERFKDERKVGAHSEGGQAGKVGVVRGVHKLLLVKGVIESAAYEGLTVLVLELFQCHEATNFLDGQFLQNLVDDRKREGTRPVHNVVKIKMAELSKPIVLTQEDHKLDRGVPDTEEVAEDRTDRRPHEFFDMGEESVVHGVLQGTQKGKAFDRASGEHQRVVLVVDGHFFPLPFSND